MTCHEMRLDIPRLLAGELPAAAARALDDHLRRCPECAAERGALAPVVAALGDAPLDSAPPPGLEGEVFALVRHTQIADLLRAAPLTDSPPDDLERRALTRAGVTKRPPRRARTAALAASLVALGGIALGVAGLSWRGEATLMAEQFGAPGRPLEFVRLRGPSPFPPGGGVEVEVVHYEHDDYGVVLRVGALPPCDERSYYEVWLTRPGHRLPLGTFRVPGKDVYAFPVGADPAAFTHIRITNEPMSGSALMEGPTLWQASLDL